MTVAAGRTKKPRSVQHVNIMVVRLKDLIVITEPMETFTLKVVKVGDKVGYIDPLVYRSNKTRQL
uniref:Uncharacterized protein n=1 Tax=Tetranychus urticae TaxID=32264 RepID=T1KQF0_TETUR